MRELREHDFAPIDMVVVNLYLFVKTVANGHTTLHEALEQVDIGGVSLLRAAAKNFEHVIVLARPQDYEPVLLEWLEKGEVSVETRRRLAAIAFQHTASHLNNMVFFRTGDFKSLIIINRLIEPICVMGMVHSTGDNGNSVCDIWTVTIESFGWGALWDERACRAVLQSEFVRGCSPLFMFIRCVCCQFCCQVENE